MGKRKGIITSSMLALSILSLVNIGWGVEHGMWGSSLREGRDHVGVERLLALLDTNRVRIYLGLTDPQVERLRQIAVETEKANVKTRAEIEVRSIELREALRADKPDRDEILKQVQEISDLRREMMKHNVEAILAAKAVLSPEQQRRLFSLLENRHEGRRVEDEPGGVPGKPLPRPGVPAPVPLHPGEPPVQ
jgi:flagellar basal body-associated protein FliL